eukprot:TRINITY_DN4670_c0_g1_i3.p1 TRINITY_DN4670_c0_g1~~TRINITY_DN4670_c0_g1_i3.p1  ORF type:complete len:4935 (+),score=2334.99 TRINITY_DN4670_c0_g1_i3:176-14806(+)
MADRSELLSFVSGLAKVILDADRDAVEQAFREDHAEGDKVAEKFFEEQSTVPAIFLYDPQPEGKPTKEYKLGHDARAAQCATVPCLAIVKNSPSQPLSLKDNPIRKLVTVHTLQGSAFDCFANVIQTTFEPRMSAEAEADPRQRRDRAQVMHSMEELLANLSDQTTMVIPDVRLDKYIHEAVVQKCTAFKDLVAPDIASKIQAEKQTADKNWDSEFINQCHRLLSSCLKDIKAVVDMESKRKTSVLANARDEIRFWNDLSDALADIQKQLTNKGWHVQIDILRRSGRYFFSGVSSLETDTGLRETASLVKDYLNLLHDFPVQKLHQAKSINDMHGAVNEIYEHMKKHLKTTKYPIPRAMNLIDAVTRDFNKQLLKILSPQNLLDLEFDDFDRETRGCENLFSDWTTQYRRFNEEAKKQARRQTGTGKNIPERVQMEHLPLKQRVEQVFLFRRAHNKFVQVLKEVIPSGGHSDELSGGADEMDALAAMQGAYDSVKKSVGDRLLDVTDDGDVKWQHAHRVYEGQVERVESHITKKLHVRLTQAETATEMFRVFSKFNPLTSNRPKIRSAIQQFQKTLIGKVKEDMETLKAKFTARYDQSEARNMARVRDVPKVSGNIIWARSIERQLQTYMKRVEDVYGRGWDRLKSMRKKGDPGISGGYWTLDEQLAEFVGVKQDRLERKARDSLQPCWQRYLEAQQHQQVSAKDKDTELRIIGTAVALAFLDIVFHDCKSDWQVLHEEGNDALRKLEKQLGGGVESGLDAVRQALCDLGVAQDHMEGSDLRKQGEQFRGKIEENIKKLLVNWNEQMRKCIHQEWDIFQFTDKESDDMGPPGRSKRRVDVQGPIFKIERGEHGEELVVNFNSGIVGLIKEMQAMKWLNIMRSVDFEIAETAIAARDIYPQAMALIEATRLFQKDARTVDASKSLLLEKETRDCYKLIGQGLRLNWENELELSKVTKYTRALHESVANYHKSLVSVTEFMTAIDECTSNLEKCNPEPEAFKQIVQQMQKILDDINLGGFANMEPWVKELDAKVEGILASRLGEILTSWAQQFRRLGDQEESATAQGDDDDDAKKKKRKKTKFELRPVAVQIKISSRVMVLDPSLDAARREWTQRLQKVLAWVLSVPRLVATRFDIATDGDARGPEDSTYCGVLRKVDQRIVYEAFANIDTRCEDAFKYYEDWTKLQALWEMELDRTFELCGEDLNQWLTLLHDIRNSKTMMDSSETTKDFGAITVDYKSVQSKVAMKYDETSSKLMQRFSTLVGSSMRGFYDAVHEEREVLEKMDFSVDPQHMCRFLTRLPAIRKKHPKWKRDVELLDRSARELKKAKFKYPQDWLTFEQASSEWEAFNQALEGRNQDVNRKKDTLQRHVLEQEKKVDEEFQELKKEWHKQRPEGADCKYKDALDSIAIYQQKAEALREQFREVCEAKEALDMEVRDMNKMDALTEDIASLKNVWDQLATVYTDLNKLGDTLWKDVIPLKLKGQLREIEGKLQQFGSAIRNYPAFNQLQQMVESYSKCNNIITDLRSEALKDRHWLELQKSLRDAEGFDDMKTLTLGKVWAADLQKYQASFQAIIRQAQGELALEEFLAQVKKHWNEAEFEVVDYQKKCSLIKGWDIISEKLSEHINSLQSMRMSPYFKQFEAEGTSWEQKLLAIQDLFGMPDGKWFEVQRRWVYLEGIFVGNQDIKRQLPDETSSFISVDASFKKLMAKVKKTPFVMDSFQIPGVQQQLPHMLNTLFAIQKALGDYLEKQRREFPRFYFVGDDDLLEIMGHSKDPDAVQKHFKKMFAGIARLDIKDLAEPDSPASGAPKPPTLMGMESSETEQVPFRAAVDLAEKSAVNDWLKAVVDEMQEVLRHEAGEAFKDFTKITKQIDSEFFTACVDKYPTQCIELAGILEWTRQVEEALRGLKGGGSGLQAVQKSCVDLLSTLAQMVLYAGDSPIRRKRIEILISALVYQRDATARLMEQKLSGDKDFDWLVFMRFYSRKGEKGKEAVFAEIADACLPYSYEYLGIGERLVQTPLTDKCYLTLTQALHTKMGGAPAGPAGTGKTETTKALGTKIGRFVLVFCCDEAFDFQAMGRIFVGLCQVGAWGCFDEFNRLEERILSAVSQQIQVVQEGLAKNEKKIRLLDRDVPLHDNVGIFITMNPGYAGRSALPDNLKQLFRPVAMSAPDREIIAEVMLFSCGFQTARELSKKVVPLFQLCKDQLSQQGHYDFGLRALKGTLVNAGNMKRDEYGTQKLTPEQELQIALKSITKTIEPKLVADDIQLFNILCNDVFPGVTPEEAGVDDLKRHIKDVCQERGFVCSEHWMHKVLQVFSIQRIHHGLMLVGPTCSGKTTAWSTLLIAMARWNAGPKKFIEGVAHVMDPKAVSKAQLYGFMEPTTREWTDGIFTACLRKIVDNTEGNDDKKLHWIIFDGDVDPEWVENLNSLLDDNKLLTLPNGERLQLPDNVKVIFEVQDLKYATPATVSRCGMVWFSDDVCTTAMTLHHYIDSLSRKHVDNLAMTPMTSTSKYESSRPQKKAAPPPRAAGSDDEGEEEAAEEAAPTVFGGGNQQQEMKWQLQYLKHLKPHFNEGGFVNQAVDVACEILTRVTIMEWCTPQYLTSMFNIINQGILNLFERNNNRPDFPMEDEELADYVPRRLIVAIVWGMAGGTNFDNRVKYCDRLLELCKKCGLGKHLPPDLILDYEIQIEHGNWEHWNQSVQEVEIPANKVGTNDVIVTTVDTVRHEDVVYAWLQSHRPMIFCGPPGSGKTMTLTGVLKRLTDYEPIFLNFSSGSLPEMIHKTFDHPSFVFTKEGNLPVVRPNTPGKWIVVFCDECNLPATDKYGTVRILALIRQIIERGGFFRTMQNGPPLWTLVQRVQFAGACNPPTDPGRVPMTHRFLRYAPLLYVDYPARQSLEAIYSTYCRGFLKAFPVIKEHGNPLAKAMVDFYLASQKHFTPEMQSHYVYSPRELSRWTRAVYEGLDTLEFAGRQQLTLEQLVRLSVHEGLRLFRDRLLEDEEKEWTDEQINQSFTQVFPGLQRDAALSRPVLYSTMLTKEYSDNNIEDVRQHIRGKLKVFAEEEMDVQLVVFDSVVEHILRIDRIIRQPLGHMLLVGVAGAGKTVLSKFVSWHSGMTIFQIKAHRKYTILDFEADLRQVLKRAGTSGEKICFIFDESNVMDSGFLEYMNALLASGEVPGLFEGQEYDQLMNAAREGINSAGQRVTVDTSNRNAMYKWFVQQVQINLHVIFTMNPNSPDFSSRCQTSPALFNRCTIDWFGEWSKAALTQVATEYTEFIPVFDNQDKDKPMFPTPAEASCALSESIVRIHEHVNLVNDKLRRKGAGRGTFITPRHYLDFIQQFKILFGLKSKDVAEQQHHLQNGLNKLRDTKAEVDKLKGELAVKEKDLKQVQEQADAKLVQLKQDSEAAGHAKTEAQHMAEELDKDLVQVEKSKGSAEAELAEATPTLEAAKKAVSSIPEKDLREIRQYAKPPATVERVMQMVVIMLGNKKVDWKSIKEVMQKDGFLRDLVGFDSKQISQQAKDEVGGPKYLGDAAFSSATAYKASKAAGPLYDWCSAQLKYAAILLKIKPLTMEIDRLEADAKRKKQSLEEMQTKVTQLEEDMKRMETEFRQLSDEAMRIKMQMEDTQKKFGRAQELLSSLGGEQARWEEENANFSKQTVTLVGDTLLGGGFLAYNGYFDDHHRRSVILPKWMRALKDRRVHFTHHLALMDYLSEPEQRLQWAHDGLPQDELYVENAVILTRFQRYPLIIDPSGTAVSFLMTHLKDKNIAKTSFLEDGFMKSLETALRFGYPLLVQDVEHIDPILNPILNREVSKQGGRTLVRLGEQSIDLSPAFKLFLSTRDSTHQFAPDISGRVTFANFTVTPGSLMNQCLQHTLGVECPAVQQERADLLKAQGESKLQQRVMEKELLNEISNAQGNILENDALIKKLKEIKEQTAQIQEKLSKMDETFEKIRKVERQYRPIADACSRVFFMLQQLTDLHPLYQCSLGHFMETLDGVLRDKDGDLPSAEGSSGEGEAQDGRREMILRQIFLKIYERQTRGMMGADHYTLALRLCQVRLALKTRSVEKDKDAMETDEPSVSDVPKDFWDFLLATQASGHDHTGIKLPDGLGEKQRRMLGDLLSVPAMEKVAASVRDEEKQWKELISAPDPVRALPRSVKAGMPQDGPVVKALRELLVLKVVRPDALREQAAAFIGEVFDGLTKHIKVPKGQQKSFLDVGEPNLDSLCTDAGPYTPMLLCSAPGFDASDRVQGLAGSKKKKLREIAMGSPEGYDEARKAFWGAMSNGDWVLLKNVHLAPQFLSELEKHLHTQQLEKKGDKAFRIFLTSEISPKIPPNLLRRSFTFVFEAKNGLKPNLQRAVLKHRQRQEQQGQQMSQLPKELPRLHFLAAWLHAIIMERLRYAPLGWTKVYEISEGHFRRTVDTIDSWVTRISEGRTNVPPPSLPWRALHYLLGESVYGGGIDNDFDCQLLRSFLAQFFSANAYDAGFKLTGAHEGQDPLVICPDPGPEAFDAWIQKLPEAQTPVWLGLPGLSQKMLQQKEGQKMLADLKRIQDLFEEGDANEDDEEEAPSPPGSPGNWQKKQKHKGPADPDAKEGTFIPEWARQLKKTVDAWVDQLIPIEKRDKMHPGLWDKGGVNPIAQALRREVSVANKLFGQVRGDLEAVVAVCTGDAKPTNIVRELMNLLGKEIIPGGWKKYTVPPSMMVSPWIADFAARCQCINELSKVAPDEYVKHDISLGMLLYPGAFITATRQYVARKLQYPLERLMMSVDVTKGKDGAGETEDGASFLVAGLGLQGMRLEQGRLQVLRESLSTRLGTHRLWWRKMEKHTVPKDALQLPLYLNGARTELLAKLDLPVDAQTPSYEWYQMGAAVVAWSEN